MTSVGRWSDVESRVGIEVVVDNDVRPLARLGFHGYGRRLAFMREPRQPRHLPPPCAAVAPARVVVPTVVAFPVSVSRLVDEGPSMTMTTTSLNDRAQTGGVNDDIDPAARPTRRTFSAEYKTDILAEYDSHPKGSEERGAILRREGRYTSHISEWRKQAAAGAREGLARKSTKRRSAEQVELERLRRQNERLARELKKTQTALQITGKVHALLEQLSESADTEARSKP